MYVATSLYSHTESYHPTPDTRGPLNDSCTGLTHSLKYQYLEVNSSTGPLHRQTGWRGSHMMYNHNVKYVGIYSDINYCKRMLTNKY